MIEQNDLLQCPYCLNTKGHVYVHSQFHCGQCGNGIDLCSGDTFTQEIEVIDFWGFERKVPAQWLVLNSDFLPERTSA